MQKRLVFWVFLASLVPALALAQTRTERPPFDLKSLKALHYEVASRTDLVGVGQGLQVVTMILNLPEGEAAGLSLVTRVFVLQNDRVEFDSFQWDRVPNGIEPSVNSRTFFKARWSVASRGKNKEGLFVLSGTVPLQDPGEPVRTGERTLVLEYKAESGFVQILDVTGRKPATVTATEVKIPL